MNFLKIAEHHKYPGPRYRNQGPNSGEEFYESVLKKLFEEIILKDELLTIDLDDTAGYASSFLDELIGNLVYDFSSEITVKHLKIKSDTEPYWKEFIFKTVITTWEKKRLNKLPRKPE